jgi:hypothetical protein
MARVTLAFFSFGSSARALSNGRVATSSEPTMRFLTRIVSPPLCSSNSHCTGTSAGAPLSLIKNTKNFAGLVLLAFRSTT